MPHRSSFCKRALLVVSLIATASTWSDDSSSTPFAHAGTVTSKAEPRELQQQRQEHEQQMQPQKRSHGRSNQSPSPFTITKHSSVPARPSTLDFLASPANTQSNGPYLIDDAHCTMEDLERANDSQLHSILTELKATNFFKSFVVDLDHKCPLSTWGSGARAGTSAGASADSESVTKGSAQEDKNGVGGGGTATTTGLDTTTATLGFLNDHDPDAGNCAGGGEEFDEDGEPPCKVETGEHDDKGFSAAHQQPLQSIQETEFMCDGGKDELDDDAEPLCTIQGGSDDDDVHGVFGGLGSVSSPFYSTPASATGSGTARLEKLESNALQHLVDDGFSSKDHRETFQWKSQTDMVVDEGGEEPAVLCDPPETFWMDMCSNIQSGDTTKLVNLQLNPERNTGYNGTHIWRAIYEENCISFIGNNDDMCLEERVLYRLLSGLHTSTTVSIAKNYYPPSKRKNRLNWEPNPQYFMDKFQAHPEHIRNLHFSYVVMMRAIHKATPYLRSYEIHSGNSIEDKAATVLLHRLLDSSILRSCSSIFTAFDETAMFQASNDNVVALQQKFKGVFHNISSILDCVQCQQCKLHGKMAMLGYGTALKVLFLPPNLLSLERNEVVAFINTIAKLSDSLSEVRELTHLYWQQSEEKDGRKQQKDLSPTYVVSSTPAMSPLSSAFIKDSDAFTLMDNAVGLVASLGRSKRITQDREAELVQLALDRHPGLLVLAKHYHTDMDRFLALSVSIGYHGAEGNIKVLPDAIIVGTGLAGLSAALNILDRGGSVVLIEKEHLLGGNSNKASSGINGCCPQGDKYGDTLESFRNDTIRSAGEVSDLVLIDTLVGKSEQAVLWLKDRVGVDLSLLAQLGGHSHKRTHRPNNGMAGAEIIYHIQKAVKSFSKSGRLTLKVDTLVTELLTDSTGRVTGVKYQTKGKDVEEVYAENVVLATGGFASDRSKGSYLDQHRPELLGMSTTAGPFSTGDGITLATELGAGVRDMDKVQLHPTGWVDPADPTNPSKILAAELMRGVGGILINRDGKRFCNELGTRAYVTDKMLSHDSSYARTHKWNISAEIPTFHLVLASSAAEDGMKHVKLYTHKGLLTRVEGVDGLARQMGVSERTLLSTFHSYQKSAEKGVDEFGKTSFRGAPIKDLANETFYVGTVTPVLHYCMGGITIDQEGNVKRTDGSLIPGLHAAGEVTGGVHGNNRLGGNSLLECTVFGTIVGQKLPVKTEVQGGSFASQTEEKDDSSSSQLPVITLAELAKHNTPDDLWVAIHGFVYDFTDFADEHPAGAQSIYDLAGTDGTTAFAAVHNQQLLDDFEEDKKGILEVLPDKNNKTETDCHLSACTLQK